MPRLTLFLKGNVDVHDSLHSCRIGGQLLWNGINEVLRASHPGCLARVRHETWTRSDALLACAGTVPEALSARQLSLGPYPEASQFSRAVFEAKADAVILSVQPDVDSNLWKHKREGFLFYASKAETWSAEDRQWLNTDFELVGRLDCAESMANLTAIVEKIRQRSDAPILVYNLSAIIPGDTIHCHQGLGEAYATRIRRFNLGLVEVSEKTGLSVIDVDALMARKGTETLKIDTIHLTPQGYRLVAEEVVRVLHDLGVLDGGT